MGRVLAYDQFSTANLTTGVANLGAGSTLLKARLACYTAFSTQNTSVVFQFAPPNTILGISWVAHGTAVPTIDETNWKTSTWYVAGPGEMDAFDRQLILDRGQTPPFTYAQHTYATHIELDVPLFQSGAFDLGISINFLGSGFWTSNVAWMSYQFEAYFD